MTDVGDDVQSQSNGKQELLQLIQVADERKQAQEAWMSLDVKVPEYAPWAPRGYENLMTMLARAKELCNQFDASVEEIGIIASSLNAAINTMRPGNLAELENLETLLRLLKEARTLAQTDNSSTLSEGIEYADMVVKYVSDGSGTLDMIKSAEERLIRLVRDDARTHNR